MTPKTTTPRVVPTATIVLVPAWLQKSVPSPNSTRP